MKTSLLFAALFLMAPSTFAAVKISTGSTTACGQETQNLGACLECCESNFGKTFSGSMVRVSLKLINIFKDASQAIKALDDSEMGQLNSCKSECGFVEQERQTSQTTKQPSK